MHPAVLARAGLARKLRDQRAVGTLGEFVEESVHCRNVGEAVQALTIRAKFAGRPRPAQHQHCEECRRLLRNVHHAFDVVRVSRNSFAAPLDGQNHAFQAVDRRPDVRLVHVEDRISARFLIAARDERIQRERIAVGNGALFLDEDTEHALPEVRGLGAWKLDDRRLRGTDASYVTDRSTKAASPEGRRSRGFDPRSATS
jgi:hypothetical protein